MAEEAGATGVAVLAENLRPAFNRKREFIPIALESSPAASIVKISVLPARMASGLDHAVRAAESNSLPGRRWRAGSESFILRCCRLNATKSRKCGLPRRRMLSAGVRGAWRPRHDSLVPGGMEEQIERYGDRRELTSRKCKN